MEKESKQSASESVSVSKKHAIAIIGAIAMIAVFAFAANAMLNTGAAQNVVTAQAAADGSLAVTQNGKQVVQLSQQGSIYQPNPIRLKKGVPAELQVDLNTVRGCMRGIQIPAFGVRKTVSTSDNKIDFTPDKAGTFPFSCFMGMGVGQIVVEDENGNVPVVTGAVAQLPQGGSCGGSGGGCGCGG